MKKPDGFYESQLKDALQAEADKRKLTVEGTGANNIVTKDDLVLALQLDDEKSGDGKPPEEKPSIAGEAAWDFVNKKDGLTYALVITPTDAPNRWTHKLTSGVFTWEGTKDDFEKDFVQPE